MLKCTGKDLLPNVETKEIYLQIPSQLTRRKKKKNESLFGRPISSRRSIFIHYTFIYVGYKNHRMHWYKENYKLNPSISHSSHSTITDHLI